MELLAIIVHQLIKDANGVATTNLRATVIPVTEREAEFVSNVKKVYYKKSNPNYGVFDPNVVTYPFQTLLRNYLNDASDFYAFSVTAMEHLRGIMNPVGPATGGFVVFAHYRVNQETFLLTVMLNNKIQYNINDALSVEEIFSLDIEKLDVANSVNITKWDNNDETYLSFAKGRKDISIYFRNFIGCTDQTSAQQSSQSLKRAFLDYLEQTDLENAQKEDLRNRVFNYCMDQTQRNEDISLQHISGMIDPEQPELFQQFAADENYQVSPFIKGHRKTLKNLKFYVYRSRNLTIEFDSGLVNESVFYNEQENELRITNVPDALRRQLTNAEEAAEG